jgi:hypothetical protein
MRETPKKKWRDSSYYFLGVSLVIPTTGQFYITADPVEVPWNRMRLSPAEGRTKTPGPDGGCEGQWGPREKHRDVWLTDGRRPLVDDGGYFGWR